MLKKILAFGLALLLAFYLVACDGETPDNATPADTSTPPADTSTPPADDGTSPDTETTDPSTPEPDPPTLAMYTLEDDEAEFLRSLMEDTAKRKSIDISAAQGEVCVIDAIAIAPCSSLDVPEELKKISEPNLVIYDEREFYPDSSGDYVYVMYLNIGYVTWPMSIKLEQAFCENGALTVQTKSYYGFVDAGDMTYLFVFKVLKSSLDPGITELCRQSHSG